MDLQALIKRRGILKGLITKMENFSTELSGSANEEEVKFKSARAEMEIIEEQYYRIIINFNTWLRRKNLSPKDQSMDDSTNGANNTYHTASGDFKLPRLNIPIFSGDYREWQSFHDLFTAAVHENPSLTLAQKFQYLMGVLRGDASTLIRHFAITEANYYEAFTKLTKRYDRKQLSANAFIKLFMDQSPIHSTNSINIRRLLDTADEVTRGLRALGTEADPKDIWLIYIIFHKLDEESKQLWMRDSADIEFPTLTNFYDFLGKRADSLEGIKTSNKGQVKPINLTRGVHVVSPISCPVCQTSSHQLYECSKFKALDLDARRNLIKDDHICFNCLNNNHTVYNYKSRARCRVCSRKHHSLLHSNQSNRETNDEIQATSNQMVIQSQTPIKMESSSINNTKPIENKIKPSTSSKIDNKNSYVQSPLHCTSSLLPTIVINVQDHGQSHFCRALLDSGSQCSFVTEDFAQRLCLPRHNSKLTVTGLGQTNAGTCRGYINVAASSRFNEAIIMNFKCYIISKLTSTLPTCTYDTTIWNHLENLPIADPLFNKPGIIDMLIGSDYFFHIIGNKKVCGAVGTPIAQETIFGWIIGGIVDDTFQMLPATTSLYVETNLDHILKKFWEIDEISTQTLLTDENTRCEDHYLNHTKIIGGRFVVRLPFKIELPSFGKSMNGALKRLQNMETRFQRVSQFKEAYHQFMNEYKDLSHMEEIPLDDLYKNQERTFYLPHHGVFKESSTTTKLRVVFDASFKSSNGIALNDTLLVGPTLYQPLTSILLRFRMFKVVFSADFEKMFRQILVDPKDIDYQQILWRNSTSDPVVHYRLKTVTYGTSSAPYLTTKTIQVIGNELLKSDPAAANVILNNFYVDDLMSGAHTVEDALRLQDKVSTTLKSYGLRLRKWSSNSIEVLNCIDHDDKEKAPVDINDDSTYVKLLGIQWHPVKDEFRFHVRCNDEIRPTKRNILSFSVRIFDPLGWLAPVVINFKIIFQNLWLLKLNWDDEIPSVTSEHWLKVKNEMACLQNLSIPRWLLTTDKKIELHGFTDASENAYAAVVYCRTIDETGKITIRLMTARTKVAPINQVSIPRLELCAAVLLKKLLMMISETLGGDLEITAWTDSTIKSLAQSAYNPADCATRGWLPQELIDFRLWWHGPEWLLLDSSQWPEQPQQAADATEEKSCVNVLTTTTEFITEIITTFGQRCSTFQRIVKIMGWVNRFLHNLQHVTQRWCAVNLSVEEIITSQLMIFKFLQMEYFKNELTNIQTNNIVSKKSKLYQLTPFVDKDGIMRVGGRIQHSSASFSTRNPIILPRCYITKLLVTQLHQKNMHAGATLLISIIRQNYHIVQCRYLVKDIIRRCVVCTRYHSQPNHQIMGNLPAARVNYESPFAKVGVDYAGPLMIKQKHGRGLKHSKAYLAIFVCMCTKAVHIEVVSDPSTDAFMASLKRFISRRGLCVEVFSDNGSNFIGAKNTITELYTFIKENSNDISSMLATDSIKWHLIPSAAPSFGGLWEAAVKSFKYHLRRVMGNNIYTFEELTTIAVQIEGILNSRPICILSIEDIDALTPGHFLIGRPITQMAEPELNKIPLSHLAR